jgi:ABC-2 type transport system permease protein
MTANLIKAEFRKVLSTRLWWALLIPTAGLALLMNLVFAAISSLTQDVADGAVHVPLAYLSLSESFGITSIFASIFGALGMATEYRHRSITTTYLTASRDGVFGAKLVVYGIFGLGYGVVTLAFSTLGVLIPGDANTFPHAGDWLLISLIGTVIIALWAVLGVGVGGFISNPIAVVLALPLYGLIGETVLTALFLAMGAPQISSFLPVKSATDSITSLASQMFIDQLKLPPDAPAIDQIKTSLSSIDLPQWWLTGLTFLGYTAVFCVLGWAVSRKRNIT